MPVLRRGRRRRYLRSLRRGSSLRTDSSADGITTRPGGSDGCWFWVSCRGSDETGPRWPGISAWGAVNIRRGVALRRVSAEVREQPESQRTQDPEALEKAARNSE